MFDASCVGQGLFLIRRLRENLLNPHDPADLFGNDDPARIINSTNDSGSVHVFQNFAVEGRICAEGIICIRRVNILKKGVLIFRDVLKMTGKTTLMKLENRQEEFDKIVAFVDKGVFLGDIGSTLM